MTKFISPLVFLAAGFFSVTLCAQQREDFNLVELARVSFEENNNDVWGYQDENGIEYAILGTREATAVYSLEDPSNPILRSYIPGATSIWRDMKSYGNHIYVTTDQGSDGILSIDMSGAPDNITHTYTNPIVNSMPNPGPIRTCHNLYIDEDGYIYLAGCNRNEGGVIILEPFTDPDSPRVAGICDARYSHDVYVQDGLAYSSDINDGFFSVIDITDKSNPITLATQQTTRDFTHNAWASEDGQYLFTTDERANAFIDAYDISDLGDITRLDTWRPRATQGSGVIPHNVHYYQGYLVISYYTDGIKIVDAHRPSNLVEVGSYDTWLGNNGGFNGCWGAFPFLESGLLLASDIQEGLIVLQPTYQRASYLEGNVVNAESGDPVSSAQVTLETDIDVIESTSAAGEFALGTPLNGTLTVRASHPAYYPWEGEISLANGEVTPITIELDPKPQYQITGTVIDSTTGEPIPEAKVVFFSDGIETEVITDGLGRFDQLIYEGSGVGIAGLWGYQEVQLDLQFDNNEELIFRLTPGYKDDFFFEYDWKSEGRGGSGFWVKDLPRGTFSNGVMINIANDLSNDIGEELYITGNGGGGPGTDDIDAGAVSLESPVMDWTVFENPEIRYWAYFHNSGGQSAPNDSLWVTLSNGEDEIVLEVITETRSDLELSLYSNLSELISFTDSMRVTFWAADRDSTPNIVEAAIDGFFVGDNFITSTENDPSVEPAPWTISPNPFAERLEIQIPASQDGSAFLLVDATGSVLRQRVLQAGNNAIDLSFLAPGVYFGEWRDSQGRSIGHKTLLKAK